MNKYAPLEKYLYYRKRYDTVLLMPFTEIEEIINAKLPPSAYAKSAWWANDSSGSHTHARAWINAGWRVDRIDLMHKQVQFTLVE